MTPSGIPLEPLVTGGDLGGFDEARSLGFPGSPPFTRGIHPSMYRQRLWTMRQYAGFGTAAETNRRFRMLIQGGQTGLSVAFDLPTQIGLDSDHPMSMGEVGRVGVAVDTIDDLDALFEGIELAEASVSMTINATAPMLLAMYLALARRRGTPWGKLKGTVQNDVLKEFVARGTWIFPPGPSLDLAVSLITFCADEVPGWNTISISGYHMREAGSTAVQEIAFTLADGLAYAERVRAAGLPCERFLGRFSFFFGVHNHLLEEVAKFRAARRLWARLVQERLGVSDPKLMQLRFHTQTAGCSLTAAQPINNAVRVAMQALAAVLGGTQSLHTNSWDEALSLPSEESVRLALRTQQIIAHESGVTDTVDPLGGAFAVEALTDRIEASALSLIGEIDRMGGMVPAVEAGWVAERISRSAYEEQRRIEEGSRVVVGVNRFCDGEKASPPPWRVDPESESRQKGSLAAVRGSRDGATADAALAALKKTVLASGNPMPALVAAADARCTLGEMTGIFREVHGEFRPK
jgi:methylmalonyl-CoA mutase N-terminal domain/subunit